MFTFLGTLFVSSLVFTQEKNDVIQQRIEFIAEQMGAEEIDLTGPLSKLNDYYDSPINLNSTTAEELEDLGLLNEIQINNLLLLILLLKNYLLN